MTNKKNVKKVKTIETGKTALVKEPPVYTDRYKSDNVSTDFTVQLSEAELKMVVDAITLLSEKCVAVDDALFNSRCYSFQEIDAICKPKQEKVTKLLERLAMQLEKTPRSATTVDDALYTELNDHLYDSESGAV